MTLQDIQSGVLEEVASLLTAELGEFSEEAVKDQTLEELGVDSLMMLELLTNVERRFDLPEADEELGENWISQFRTMDDIVAMVANARGVSIAA